MSIRKAHKAARRKVHNGGRKPRSVKREAKNKV